MRISGWSSDVCSSDLDRLDVRIADDDRDDLAPPALVGQSHDDALLDSVEGEERGLDLCGVDVLAPGDDQVIAPVGDIEVALLVEVAQVARAQPAVAQRRGGRVRTVEVPRAYGRPHHANPADLPGLGGAALHTYPHAPKHPHDE